ncbi:MAG: RHS repeat-associated core domain-containing protein [Planctomycetaceae bacterium]|nr:RHS repeat-associated core domain-containing protein [Planctomycetaceae bacterium]
MLVDPLDLSHHQRTPSPPPLSSSCTSHRSAKLKTSNPCNHRIQQYSIIGLTNAAGTIVERYSYTAYGTLGIYAANGTVRTTSTYANRYTYTGREYDADLNLYHFRARWYDPATGGFISSDPLGYVDGMSLYRGYFGIKGVAPNGSCELDITISFPEDDVTQASHMWNFWLADRSFIIDPHDPDWGDLWVFLVNIADGCCIKNVILNGHGSFGKAGPFTSSVLAGQNSEERLVLDLLRRKRCDDCFVDIRHCYVAGTGDVLVGDDRDDPNDWIHRDGQQFLLDSSRISGCRVRGITDMYAVNPHGDQHDANPDGTIVLTESYGAFRDSWIHGICYGGHKAGNKPDKPKPKTRKPVKSKPNVRKPTFRK